MQFYKTCGKIDNDYATLGETSPLRAAQVQGRQAAFVPHPLEQGPSHLPDLTSDPACEVVATNFMDLAQQFAQDEGRD